MQFLNSLFADNRLLTLGAAVVAFVVFAVFILLFVRLLFGNRLRMSGGRGRQQRLGVVDAYDMDRQRQLILVRRDNTEHLIMIGGPNDVLIESTILRVEEREVRNRPAGFTRDPAAPEAVRVPIPDAKAIPAEDISVEPAPMPAVAAPIRVTTVSPPPQIVASPPPPVAPSPPPVAPPAPEQAFAPPPPDRTVSRPGETLAPPTPELAARSKEAMRLPDLFANMRSGRAAAPVAREPAAPATADVPARNLPSFPSPPPTRSPDPLETEIARALAPSIRERTASPSVAEPAQPPAPDLTSVPPNMEAPLPPAVVSREPSSAPVPSRTPTPSPRPFRPFPPRRELPVSSAPNDGARPDAARTDAARTDSTRPSEPAPRPSRPPPPFFSRMAQRTPERVEPPVETPPSVETTASATPKAPVAELSPPPTQSAPAAEPVQAAPEPVSVPAPPPAAPKPSAAPAPSAEPIDPFEEEMARLLGRTPGKDG